MGAVVGIRWNLSVKLLKLGIFMHVLADKNIFLWKEMLQAINYEDMGVVDEFMCGTSLVGAAPATGLWPAKFTPATMSVGELHMDMKGLKG